MKAIALGAGGFAIACGFCACTAPLPPSTMTALAPSSKTLATIYVFDDLQGGRMGNGEILLVNGQAIGSLDRREYTWFQVPAGTVELSLTDPVSEVLARRPLDVSAGQTYYVRYQVQFSGMPPIVDLVNSFKDRPGYKPAFHPEDLATVSTEAGAVYVGSDTLVGNHLQAP
jgi:hypothetical protein